MTERKQSPDESRAGSIALAIGRLMSLAVVLVVALIYVRMEHQPNTSRKYPSRAQMPDGPSVLMSAPEIDDEYLPCGDCHEPNDKQTNVTVRELEEDHDEMKFSHGDLWCMDCHDVNERKSLHRSDGSLVAFEDSWQLCTQCHGKKLRDWRAGVHGKRTGHWRGAKEYRTCVVCHDPHDPPFKSIAPKPAPRRPEEIIQAATSARAVSNAGRMDREDS